MSDADILFGPIRPEGSDVTPEDVKAQKRAYYANKKAMKLATGEKVPQEFKGERHTAGRPKSIVNRVTEYGALFNKLNQERLEKGLPPLKTAMDILIEAIQSDELELKDKAKIAEKLATFESSRAPIISIEHVQNIQKDEELGADDALDDFLDSLKKV